MHPDQFVTQLIHFWLVISAVCVAYTHAAWFGVQEKRFKGEAMLDLGRLGLENGLVAAFADINSDQSLDMLVLSSDQRSVSAWVWNAKPYKFIQADPAPVQMSKDLYITAVIPGDFNYDGITDLLLLGQSSSSDHQLSSEIRIGFGNGTFGDSIEGPVSSLSQPTILDANGTMHPDLLGVPPDSKEGQVSLWKNTLASNDANNSTGPPFEVSNLPLNGSFSVDCDIPNPHSNAWVDIDGDCLADLFLTCRDSNDPSRLTYQIWLNKKQYGYQFARAGSFPPGTGQILFADMDRDGAIDMIFPVCNDESCSINIAYNIQTPLCTAESKENPDSCRRGKSLCIADPHFYFSEDLSTNSANVSSFQLKQLLPDHPYFINSDPDLIGTFPQFLRIGDYNHDGYPDILLISSGRSNAFVGTPALLQSEPCDDSSICTNDQVEAHRRSFGKVTKGVSTMDKVGDAMNVAWIDVDEDGSLDILMQRRGTGGSASRSPVFLKNNYYHDAFFLKASTTNGACPSTCDPRQGNNKPFKATSVNYPGATYKFTVLDSSGKKIASHAPQLPQSSYNALNTPYTHLGLGRLNNYIESLYVGSTRHQNQHYAAFEGIIPNSQLVIIPYQSKDANTPSAWARSLYLHPSDWIPWVGLAVVISTIVLGALVIVLHINEKREDEAERRRKLHRINFDAL